MARHRCYSPCGHRPRRSRVKGSPKHDGSLCLTLVFFSLALLVVFPPLWLLAAFIQGCERFHDKSCAPSPCIATQGLSRMNHGQMNGLPHPSHTHTKHPPPHGIGVEYAITLLWIQNPQFQSELVSLIFKHGIRATEWRYSVQACGDGTLLTSHRRHQSTLAVSIAAGPQ